MRVLFVSLGCDKNRVDSEVMLGMLSSRGYEFTDDEELAEALKQLPEQSRNIVLMFFFLDMSDSEIGEKLNINRSTSYRHRRNSLEEIRKQLKEKKTNEE